MVFRSIFFVLLAMCVIPANTAAALPRPVSVPPIQPGVVVFTEPAFPSADSAQPSEVQLRMLFRGAEFASVEQLGSLLASPSTQLLVLPYGSAFPEEAWPGIHEFLKKGGNLLVLGGRPFTRAAYRDASGWRL